MGLAHQRGDSARAADAARAARAKTAVDTISTVWLGIGVLAGVSAAGGFAVSFLLPEAAPRMPSSLDFLFRHYRTLAILQLGVAGGIAFSARSLLRRRPWARPAIQGWCMALLLWIAVFAIFWVPSTASLLAGAGGPAGAAGSVLSATMAALSMLPIVAGLGACIWILAKPEVRAQFRDGRGS